MGLSLFRAVVVGQIFRSSFDVGSSYVQNRGQYTPTPSADIPRSSNKLFGRVGVLREGVYDDTYASTSI